jgi:phosphoribosylamine--glycine ligase
LCDGRSFWILDAAQDHKRVGEGDTGPNTGGMGAFSPTPRATPELLRIVERDVLVPTVDALKRMDIPFRGVLYAGIMLTPAGPKVLEFNTRFGDPETQPMMARLKGDLVELCWATATGQLDETELSFDQRAACCVVVCSKGYPGSYAKGLEIEGLDEARAVERAPGEDIVVFHAGTSRKGGKVVTNGGRVVGVTALARDLGRARDLANMAAARIRFEGAFYRRDIGSSIESTLAPAVG